ncbi:MAG TPA: PKD domain-containing protein, partial [Candidatus Limnocylindria bacterium]|nr:PKD domain-containing protein [Candidatus Limnocylindria bacterium]
ITSNFTLSGESGVQNHGSVLVHCDPCVPDALITNADETTLGILLELGNQVTWSAPASIATKYDTDQIRQGSTVDLTNTLTTSDGTISVKYILDYTAGLFVKGGDFPDPGPLPGGWNASGDTTSDTIEREFSTTCAPPPSGSTVCHASQTVDLIDLCCFLDFGLELDLEVEHDFHVNADGVVTHRIVSVATVPDADLNFTGSSPSVVDDQFDLGCLPVGTNVTYAMDPIEYSPSVSVTGELNLNVTFNIPLAPDVSDSFNLLSGEVFSDGPPMTGSPTPDFSLGPLLADNQPPEVTLIQQIGPFTEGSPNTFAATAEDNCGTSGLDYDWAFSDGGQAFGQTTAHAFADNGAYTGHLTVTDQAGNEALSDFNVTLVTNLPPNVTAPPNANAYWGVPIALHVSAIDPGSADQPTLAFSWDFDDGSMANGANVSHAWAMPGSYSAEVTVTDKDGGSASAAATIVIAKRPTTLVYSGDIQGGPNKYVTLRANLTDVLNAAVVGRTVSFVLGTQSTSAQTDSAGDATKQLKLLQKPDPYTVTASFAGDALYEPSTTGPIDFTIGNGGGGNNGVGGGGGGHP